MNFNDMPFEGRNIDKLVKPNKLRMGDKVAIVSLSWGGAGNEDLIWRYNQGKERLEKLFGLKVVEMPNTLKGSEYVYNNPRKRAEDLMSAFLDEEIKGIFCTMGGDDSIRILPFINFEIIKNNAKIFVGNSDSTITNLICMKAGLSSFYGPSIMCDFAENINVPEYTIRYFKKALFEDRVIGEIVPSDLWTSEFLDWNIKNKEVERKFVKNGPYNVVQGAGIVNGRLIGGCIDVLEFAKGTDIFPKLEEFENSILFLETSEEMPPPKCLERWLRGYGTLGILSKVNGIIFGKPYNEMYFQEYQQSIKKILNEYGRNDLPVLFNLNFGHCEPKFCIPYGAMAQINCSNCSFSILENSVI